MQLFRHTTFKNIKISDLKILAYSPIRYGHVDDLAFGYKIICFDCGFQLIRSSDKLKGIKNEIIAIFKEQMRLRKKLLNIDGYLLSMQLENERQRSIIADWEARNGKLYQHNANTGTQFSYCRNVVPLTNTFIEYRF